MSAPVTGLMVLAFAIWTHAIAGKGLLLNPVEIIAVLAIFAAAWLIGYGLEGWAFAATTHRDGGRRSCRSSASCTRG